MKLAVVLTLLFNVGACSQIPFGDSIMPFGAYSGKWANESYYSDADSILAQMRDYLGFNQHLSGGFTPSALALFIDHGIYPHVWTTAEYPSDANADKDPQMKYSHTHYVISHPESDSTDVYHNCFYTDGTDTFFVDEQGDTAWYLSSIGTDSLMLSYHGMDLYNHFSNKGFSQFRFYPKLKLGVNPLTDTSLVAGIFTAVNRIYAQRGSPDSLRFIDTIYVSDLPRDTVFRDIELSLKNQLAPPDTLDFFYAAETELSDSAYWFHFRFEPSQQCTVYVDYFKMYDQYAKQLFEGDYDEAIMDSTCRDAYRDKIQSWFLFDTQHYPHFRPFAYIDSLIRVGMDSNNSPVITALVK